MNQEADRSLSGRVALVTGGAGGIGSAICAALAAAGATVAIHYHTSEEKAADLRERLNRYGGQSGTFKADLLNETETREMVKQVAKSLGRIDILVNNAGWTQVVPPAELDGLTDELIARTLALKVNAPLYTIRAARTYLEASGAGCVVNITSVAGIAARGSSIAYAAANAALSSLTRSLARILAPRVRVNAVAPGFVDTGFAWPTGGDTAARVAGNNYLGRCITPQDVAAAVRFLCAEGNSITGEELVVDAGIGRLGINKP